MTCLVPPPARARRRAVSSLALTLLLAGCGGGGERSASELRLEELSPAARGPDTSGLSRGRPLLTALEPYRLPNGAIRVRGRLDFPDGTRVQISLHRRSDQALIARTQVRVEGRAFESGDLFGERGPHPEDDYRIELLSHFNETWQPAEVLRATGDGRRLRGPGITRGAADQAAFLLNQEVHL